MGASDRLRELADMVDDMEEKEEYAEFTLQSVQVFGRRSPKDPWMLCLTHDGELPDREN